MAFPLPAVETVNSLLDSTVAGARSPSTCAGAVLARQITTPRDRDNLAAFLALADAVLINDHMIVLHCTGNAFRDLDHKRFRRLRI